MVWCNTEREGGRGEGVVWCNTEREGVRGEEGVRE